MKIGIFTDSHYSSQEITCTIRYNSKSLAKIEKAYSFFEKENCDLVVCLGDIIDKEDTHEKEIENLKKVAKIINSSGIKTVCLMGNHDGFAFLKNEFYNILGTNEPADIETDENKLIFLDTCYFTNGNHYIPGDTDWTNAFLPDLKNFKERIKTNKKIYIFSHHNIDLNAEESHRINNAEEINDILRRNKNIKTVYQGHFHQGAKSFYNGINFITFPAMCQNDDAVFIEEI